MFRLVIEVVQLLYEHFDNVNSFFVFHHNLIHSAIIGNNITTRSYYVKSAPIPVSLCFCRQCYQKKLVQDTAQDHDTKNYHNETNNQSKEETFFKSPLINLLWGHTIAYCNKYNEKWHNKCYIIDK